ncbi:hypothetical protein SCHPADRAFT_936960 [Schizopora paradoxa]|uniref:CFEM domain-containing protein n=1 Tax=Schizopora paradoxa TaxID=27342 RepID=A0A0H2S166_9AGAM|nr:hypothetical protein SCHPADRAFT_936960 [Schizopora paradoxa]
MSSFQTLLVALTLGVAGTFAQTLPTCVVNCIMTSTNSAGCTGPMDTTDCICASQSFLSSVAECMSTACDSTDLATGQAFITSTCDVVTVSVPLSTSSGATSLSIPVPTFSTLTDTTTATAPTATSTLSIPTTLTSLSVTTSGPTTVTIIQTVVSSPLPSVITVTSLPGTDTSPFFGSPSSTSTSTTTVTQTGGAAGTGAATRALLFGSDYFMGGILAPVLLPILGMIGGAFLL